MRTRSARARGRAASPLAAALTVLLCTAAASGAHAAAGKPGHGHGESHGHGQQPASGHGHGSGHGHEQAAGHGQGHGHDQGHGHALGFGGPGEAAGVTRNVDVVMTDNRFDREEIVVRSGETIRFRVHNRGRLLHEFNLGTADMHRHHQTEMATMMQSGALTPFEMKSTPGGMTHDDPNSVLVEPDETGEIIWKFNRAAKLEFACNIPGHYQSGMKGRLEVEE